MAGGHYMAQGLLAAGDALGGAIEHNKERAKERKRLEKLWQAIDPEGREPYAEWSLEDLQGHLEARTLKAAEKIQRRRIKESQAQTAAAKAQQGYYAQRQEHEAADRAAGEKQQLAFGRYLEDYGQEYGDVLAVDENAVSILNPAARRRWYAARQDPRADAYRFYKASGGQAPGGYYAQLMASRPESQFMPQWIKGPDGQMGMTTSRNSAVAIDQRTDVTTFLRDLDGLMARGLTQTEALDRLKPKHGNLIAELLAARAGGAAAPATAPTAGPPPGAYMEF